MEFIKGKSYQAKYKRKTLSYYHYDDDFYELHIMVNSKKDPHHPVILFKDLMSSIRNYFGFPKDVEKIIITEIIK